jgi:hypothetical protein
MERSDPAVPEPDRRCVPYRRRGWYWTLTGPFLAVLVLVLIRLWTVHPGLSIVMLLLYLLTCVFQAYCCAYQECPYIGGFCPAIAGIVPASFFARWLFRGKRPSGSRRRFGAYVTLAILSWLCLIVLPVPWITRLGGFLAVGYVALHALYTVVFFLTVCPACAIRHICPGGNFQTRIRSAPKGS